MTTCPICHRRSIGKVGVEQYYCWECCIEFALNDNDITAYNVEADGSLTLYDPTLNV